MNAKKILIGFILGAILLFVFIKSVNLKEVWAVLLQGNPWWILLGLGMILLSFVVRSIRWHYLLRPIKRNTKLWNLLKTTFIGFGINAVIPARVGEIVRPYMLGAKENISKSAALATIVVERLFDTLAVLFLLVFYLLLLVRPEQLNPDAASSLGQLKKTGVILFVIVLLMLVFLYYLKTSPAMVKKILLAVERKLPSRFANTLDEIFESFIKGLSILDSPKTLASVSLWSLIFWLIISVSFWASVRAYITEFDFVNTFLVMIILAIGVAVPTPGGVGSYHLAIKISLTKFFNAPENEAGAIALVNHFINFFPVAVIGLSFLWHEGLTAGKLKKIAEGGEPEGEKNVEKQPEENRTEG